MQDEDYKDWLFRVTNMAGDFGLTIHEFVSMATDVSHSGPANQTGRPFIDRFYEEADPGEIEPRKAPSTEIEELSNDIYSRLVKHADEHGQSAAFRLASDDIAKLQKYIENIFE